MQSEYFPFVVAISKVTDTDAVKKLSNMLTKRKVSSHSGPLVSSSAFAENGFCYYSMAA